MHRPHYPTELTKYYVETDEDGYVVAINHTGTYELDTVPLDLSLYDFSGDRMGTYKLVGNTLVQDPVKLAQVIAEEEAVHNQERIAWLKEQLNSTDYIMARWGEEIISCQNPVTWIADVVKINIKYLKEYKEAFVNRKAWREEIEEREKN